MSILVALLAIPLMAMLFITLARRTPPSVEFALCVLAAAVPVAVATFARTESVEFDYLFTMQKLVLRLDGTARAALLLFGGLWLATLLLHRTRGGTPAAIPLLVTLTGAITVAVAVAGPLVFTGMLVTGFGLYAIMASEPGRSWDGPARVWVTLLVLSDLLIFEILLHAAAHPTDALGSGLTIAAVGAIVLRAGVAPGPQWQPVALPAVGQPTALLLTTVPAAAALIGGQKLFGSPGEGMPFLCLAAGLFACCWAAVAGIAQVRALPTLGYAAAASAALLLTALPIGTAIGTLPWLIVSLMASCAAAVDVQSLNTAVARAGARTATLSIHAVASARVAQLASSELSPEAAMAASIVAVLPPVLLTLAICRSTPDSRETDSPLAGLVAATLLVPAGSGLLVTWSTAGMIASALWPAPVGIGVGLVLSRWRRERNEPLIPPGDFLGASVRTMARIGAGVAGFCTGALPRYRDRMQQLLFASWRGDRWAARIAAVESVLGTWSVTGVLVMLTSIAAAILLLA